MADNAWTKDWRPRLRRLGLAALKATLPVQDSMNVFLLGHWRGAWKFAWNLIWIGWNKLEFGKLELLWFCLDASVNRLYHEDWNMTQVIAQRLLFFSSAWLCNRERWWTREARLGSGRECGDVDNGPGGYNGPGRRRRAGRFVQSGRTAFFPVPVLRTSTTGRTVTFFCNNIGSSKSDSSNGSCRPAYWNKSKLISQLDVSYTVTYWNYVVLAMCR